MKQLYQKSNRLKALGYFYEHPYSEVHLRELARSLKMSPSTVARILKALEKEGWVEKREEKYATFFKANMSPAFKAHKQAYTMAKIRDSSILEIVQEKTKGLHSFMLFGSAARGEDDEKSDYDFIIVAGGSDVKSRDLAKKLGREVNLKTFSISEWKKVEKTNQAFYRDVLTYSWVLLGQKPVL
ncbi:winged helix-turn-helix transcriptional regulator [Candidatus Micrarchaeota archaeon]|nr:winged helix-turn-helix transcriptional regulator [Candidatus Micrarchaeota archaeon]